MKIRKEFRVESAHIVRNCSSERCSHSIHGHSAVIELFFEASRLDNAQMVYDFGLMKGSIKSFIDSMDHSYLLCKNDSKEFKAAIKDHCDRWIELPFNPSAEMLSLWILNEVRRIILFTQTNNGESSDMTCTGVRYHETTTGWAESSVKDLRTIWKPEYEDVRFSYGVMKDWSDELNEVFIANLVENPIVEQQIKL